MPPRGLPPLALAVLLGACGDDLPPTLALDAYATAHRDAECAHLTRCGLFASVRACQAFLRIDPDADLLDAVARGAVQYSASRAYACVVHVADQSCDLTDAANRQRSPCDDVFTGSRVGGEACALDESCRSRACDVAPCAEACCRGVCRDAVPTGPAGRRLRHARRLRR